MLGVVDVTAAYVALFIAVYAVHGDHTTLSPWTVLLAPFVLLASKVIGLYDRDQHLLRKTTLDEMPQILYLSVMLALGTWLTETVVLHGYLTRPQVFTLTLCSFCLMTLGRLSVRAAVLAVTSHERCIVLGSAANARRIADKLADARSTNAVVVGRVAIDPREPEDGAGGRAPVKLGDFRSLVGVVGAHAVERVIIAPGHDGEDDILDAIRVIKALGVKVSVLPRLLEVVGSSSSFDDVNGMWLLGVRHFGLSRSSETLKRMTDVIGAGLLLVVLLPLLVMLGLAVKLTSRGPVFFSQKRIGRQGEVFKMLKFRSMVVGADRRQGGAARAERGGGGSIQDRRGSPCHARRQADAPHLTRRAPAVAQRPTRRDEPGRASSARARRGRAHRRLAAPAPRREARDDRPLADLRLGSDPDARDGQDRLSLRRELVDLAGHEDPPAHDPVHPRAQRAMNR